MRAHLVPIGNTQAIVIRQTPLDRWHGVAMVPVDPAGQAHTGGGPHLGNVPLEGALGFGRTLAQRAAAARYRWG